MSCWKGAACLVIAVGLGALALTSRRDPGLEGILPSSSPTASATGPTPSTGIPTGTFGVESRAEFEPTSGSGTPLGIDLRVVGGIAAPPTGTLSVTEGEASWLGSIASTSYWRDPDGAAVAFVQGCKSGPTCLPFALELRDAGSSPGADEAWLSFPTSFAQNPYVGQVSMFRVLSGTVRPDDHLVNSRTGADERLHGLLTVRGREQEQASELVAGDIGAVSKLAGTVTGDTLAPRGMPVRVEPVPQPEPTLSLAVLPRTQADEDKLATALHRLQDEDPAIRIERNPETHQTVVWGMGETHVGIALEKLERKFGAQVDTEEVLVAYRETITGTAEAEGRYKKQTGGHGQFGVAFLRVAPLERGSGFEFVDAIVGGVIPRQFIPAVEKGVVETMGQGGFYGFPVVDVQVTVFDGKHHPVDSSEMSFKMAGSLGFKEAMAKASPIVLEPISELVVTAPEAYQGDIMGDLNSKRGRIQGSGSAGGGEFEIQAFVPTSEILRYAIDLRSITGGRGRFSVTHSHYDPLPAHLADKVAKPKGE